MKKIFAIALALVMVLSMASAFAWCNTVSWDCDSDVCANGKGKVEVIPYVKGNGCDGTGNTFTANDCAGAVFGDMVYFAVKVTVDADANTEWWDGAELKFTLKGLDTFKIGATSMTSTTFGKGLVAGYIKALDTDGELKAGEYYLVYDGAWKAVKAADFSAKEANLFSAKVTDASIAKVCATLEAETKLVDGQKIATVNGYDVIYNNAGRLLQFNKDGKYVGVKVDADGKINAFDVFDGVNVYTVKTYNSDGTKFWAEGVGELDWTCNAAGKFLKAVMDEFKLAFGTCITKKAIKINFGWADKIEDCFSWSDKVVSVVDPNCVVSIPKTGDVSVVAYAVMAVVAAAGAMLKK